MFPFLLTTKNCPTKNLFQFRSSACQHHISSIKTHGNSSMSLKLRGIEYVYNCKWVLACCWFMSFGCVPKLGTWLLSFCKLKSAGPNQGHNLFEVTWSSVMQLRVPIKDRPCHSMLIRNFEGKHPFIGRLQAFLNSHENSLIFLLPSIHDWRSWTKFRGEFVPLISAACMGWDFTPCSRDQNLRVVGLQQLN